MTEELHSSELFHPSVFWTDINDRNVRMLNERGLENFKRTVSQNYYNWTISVRSPLLLNVLKQWARAPRLTDLMFSVDPEFALQSLSTDMHNTPWHRRYAYAAFEVSAGK